LSILNNRFYIIIRLVIDMVSIPRGTALFNRRITVLKQSDFSVTY